MPHVNDLKHDVLDGLAIPAITYLLRAPFTAANQAFADAQVLDTAAEGVEDGSLTVVETDGAAEVLGNALKLSGLGANDTDTLGVHKPIGITRSIGLPYILTSQTDAAQATMLMRLEDAAGMTAANRVYQAIFSVTNDIRFDAFDGAGGNHFLVNVFSGYSLNTDYKFALVLGGYNSGVPYNTGDTKANFKDGCSMFFHDTTQWLLLYRTELESQATLYASVSAFISGQAALTKDIKIPNTDLSDLQIPNNLDTSVATTDTFTHIADCVIESLVTTLPSSGNYDIEFRRQDDTHKWICRTTSAGAISLIEDNAGEVTRIGPVAAAVSNGDRIVITAEDDDIVVYSADTKRGTYASAANFKTDTGGKVVFGSGAIAHIADWSRGIDGAYSDLDNF